MAAEEREGFLINEHFDWRELYDRGYEIDHPVTPQMIHTGLVLKQSIILTTAMAETWLSLLLLRIKEARDD